MPDGHTAIQFYTVRISSVLLDLRAVNENLGLAQYFQGALALAEVFAPNPEVAIVIGDQPDAGGWTEALLCFDCYTTPIRICGLAEGINDRKAAAEAAAEKGCAE